jgi:hypothetical protein
MVIFKSQAPFPREKIPSTQWIEDWVGIQTLMDAAAIPPPPPKKSFSSYREWKQVFWRVVVHSTDWDIVADLYNSKEYTYIIDPEADGQKVLIQ